MNANWKRRRAALFFVVAALPLAVFGAIAQTYPNRPLHVIVPFTPGGSSDVLARAIGQELGRALGQPVVIENVPGAGGALGGEKAAKSAPDGYTLFMGQIAYGSGGNGSAAHITMEYLKMQTGTSILHVPYRGTVPSVTDLLAGQIQVLFTGAPALLQHIKAGRMRALAVSSPQRLAVLPDVPTVAETGVPGTKGFEADQWYGLVAPAGTPTEIVTLLNREVNKALESEGVRARFAAEGAEPTPVSPQVFGRLIAGEIGRWEKVVKTAGVKAE